MKSVYDTVPSLENEKYLLRFVKKEDAKDLREVYSDKNALPFFNSDNCHGDNFYYQDIARMEAAIDFWLKSYELKYFVRWAIIDKSEGKAIGSIELFHRDAEDYFNHAAVLRLDLKSDFEREHVIAEIARLIIPSVSDSFGTNRIVTKIPLYAVERAAAFAKLGFKKSNELLVGTQDGYAYKDYWEKTQEQ